MFQEEKMDKKADVVGNDIWQDAQKRYPQLKDFEELKKSPQDFVAVVKSLHEIEIMEEKGDCSLSAYKNPEKILKLVDEAKPFEAFFGEVAQKDIETVPFEIFDDCSASTTLVSNDNLTASPSFNDLIKNKSGLPEIVQMREAMVTGLSFNLPHYVSYNMSNTESNAKEITALVEEDPKAVMALMAISRKNQGNGEPQVKIFSPKDMKAKLENREVQELASVLPLTQCYGFALDYAEASARPVKGLDINRDLNAEKSNFLYSSRVHTAG